MTDAASSAEHALRAALAEVARGEAEVGRLTRRLSAARLRKVAAVQAYVDAGGTVCSECGTPFDATQLVDGLCGPCFQRVGERP